MFRSPSIRPIAVAALLAAGCVGASDREGGTVSAADVETLLRAKGAALYAPDPGIETELEFALSDLPFRGLAVAVPPTLDPGASLPVALAVQRTRLRGWEVADERNLVVAVAEVASGRVWFAPALDDPKQREWGLPPQARRPPRPEGIAAQAVETRLLRFDLAARGSLPPLGGELTVTALAGDWRSNVARATAAGPVADRIERPVVAAPGDKRRRIDAVPDYAPGALVPPAPATPGLALRFRADPVQPAKPVAEGAFLKRAHGGDLVPAAERRRHGAASEPAAAVVRVVLAAFAADDPVPVVVEFGVPVATAGEPAAGALLAGGFRVPFVTAGGSPLPPGRYVVYGFVGGEPTGPVPVVIGRP